MDRAVQLRIAPDHGDIGTGLVEVGNPDRFFFTGKPAGRQQAIKPPPQSLRHEHLRGAGVGMAGAGDGTVDIVFDSSIQRPPIGPLS
jgi:hypothetical protein